MPVVYVDMLFLLNFFMDSVILITTSQFIKSPIKLCRIVLSSTLCAIYSCVMFFPRISFMYSAVFKLLFLILIMYISFPKMTPVKLIKNTIVFIGVNCLFSGLCFFLIFRTNFGTTVGSVVSNGEIYLNIAPSTLVFSTMLAYLIAWCISYIKKQNLIQERITMEITIYFNSKYVTVNALCDTGCTLCEPISSYPAIIIDRQTAEKLIPQEQDQHIQYRVFPFSTIDNKKGILNGFIPDKIIIQSGEIHQCSVAISNAVINQSGDFSAIFNPTLLETQKMNNQTERLGTI